MTDVQSGITGDQRHDAQTLWDYHHLHHPLRPCDAAIGLGGHDLGVAACAAELYHRGLFPVLVFSGGRSRVHPERLPRGEAVRFRERALELGVPEDVILVEPDATNTGENISLSRAVLASAGIAVRSVLLITVPPVERRAFATCRRQWPGVEVVCASAPGELGEYMRAIGDEKDVLDMLVGELQRVVEYPRRGFAIAQPVPDDVRAAYERLRSAGFDSRLIKD
ncbi:YdcF family protein [Kitasatospora acidiphila]|uniref:YdcF family protein n=1 Tax=Kitasatospora acidiphila TaxID=2567942 RepID=UPI003C72F021